MRFYGNGGPLRILREQGVIPEVLVAGPGLGALVQEQQGGEAEFLVRGTTERLCENRTNTEGEGTKSNPGWT